VLAPIDKDRTELPWDVKEQVNINIKFYSSPDTQEAPIYLLVIHQIFLMPVLLTLDCAVSLNVKMYDRNYKIGKNVSVLEEKLCQVLYLKEI